MRIEHGLVVLLICPILVLSGCKLFQPNNLSCYVSFYDIIYIIF